MKCKRQETFAPCLQTILGLLVSPETAMLPAPEKIMLATLQPTTAAGCNLFRIQLHFAPRLLQKGRNTQKRILHFRSEQLNGSLHA
jgi:hypothetical protein